MEYDFYFNEQQNPEAAFDSGFCAFGLWINNELSRSAAPLLITQVLDAMTALSSGVNTAYVFKGARFTLSLDSDSACVRANALNPDDSGMSYGVESPLGCSGGYADDDDDDEYSAPKTSPDNTAFYDDELQAECGLEDFHAALLAWVAFTQN